MSVTQPQEPAVFLLQRGARGSIDGRTREGKLISGVEKDLLAALGGPPTPAQNIAIRRLALLALAAEESDTRIHKCLVEGLVSEAILRNMTETNRAICACIKELEPLANGRGATGPLTLHEYLATQKGAQP
jgi:hypothetical protein